MGDVKARVTGPRGTPLDLKAVEALIHEFDTAGDDDFGTAQRVYDELKALLAHCRALRAALQCCHDDLVDRKDHPGLLPNQIVSLEHAAAVLAQARDFEE